MHSYSPWIAALVMLGMLSAGCVTPPPTPIVYETRLHAMFENNFEDFELPSPETIQQDSIQREFEDVTTDEVWRAAVLTAAQWGLIIGTSREQGILVAVDGLPPVSGLADSDEPGGFLIAGAPTALLIEESDLAEDLVVIHANWLDDLMLRVDRPEAFALKVQPERRAPMADEFLELVEIQLYEKRRASYLFNALGEEPPPLEAEAPSEAEDAAFETERATVEEEPTEAAPSELGDIEAPQEAILIEPPGEPTPEAQPAVIEEAEAPGVAPEQP